MATAPTTSGASGTASTSGASGTHEAPRRAAHDPHDTVHGTAQGGTPAPAPAERVFTTPVPAAEDHPAEREKRDAEARHEARVKRLDTLVASLEGRMDKDNFATLKQAVDAVRGRGTDAAEALDRISWLAAPDLMADDLAVLNATVTELKAEPPPAA